MELTKEYLLYQYEELGILEGNANVKIVRNSITGKIAVKKTMSMEQLPVYSFLRSQKSPFIPEIYDYFENGQQLIVIEEYVEGRNLEDILSEQSITAENACSIIGERCQALAPLHRATPPIVCRDLKPENIMLTLEGHVKFIDFDIARVVTPGKTRDTMVMGTEGFAAPEQYGHRQTDGRSDIYALGVLLNYIILHKLPVEEMISGNLRKIVQKCTALNPDERYQTVEQLATALKKYYLPGKKLHSGATKTWKKFLPPGFRSGSIWKMAAALLGYFFLIDLSLSLDIKENDIILTGIQTFPQRAAFFTSQLVEIAFVFNYLGCREKTPILSSPIPTTRALGYIALELILMTVVIAFWLLCETLHGVG